LNLTWRWIQDVFKEETAKLCWRFRTKSYTQEFDITYAFVAPSSRGFSKNRAAASANADGSEKGGIRWPHSIMS
jgi:hypothetical protein